MPTNTVARMLARGRDFVEVVREFPEFWYRFKNDPAFRRNALFVVLFSGVLLGEVLLLRQDLPRHVALVEHTGVTVALVLLPLTLLAAAARLPVGRSLLKRRFIIRPFRALSSAPTYDGVAIASMLHREIIAWSSGAAGKVEAGASSLPAVSFSLAGTSLPLSWLWTQLRTVITGQKEIVIDGMLIDVGGTLRELRIWTDDSQSTLHEAVEGDLPDALDTAISRLTPMLLKSLNPVLLARIYAARWNYEEALSLMATEATDDHQLELARINLDGGYVKQAERHLEQASKRRHLNRSDFTTLRQLQAELHMQRGNFGEARRIVLDTLKDPRAERGERHTLHGLIGDTFAYEHNFREAIDAYMKAYNEGADTVSEMTGERSLDSFFDLPDRTLYGATKDNVTQTLWALHWIARRSAQCKELLGLDPLEDLQAARTIVHVIREIDTAPTGSTEVEGALAAADLAVYYFKKQDLGSFESFTNEAISSFDNAVLLFDYTLTTTPDDVDSVVALAWANHGKAASLLYRFHVAATGLASPLATGAEQLTRVFRGFTEDGKRTFAVQFERACDLSAKQRLDDDRLNKCAISFLEALLQLEPPAVIEGLNRIAETPETTTSSETAITATIVSCPTLSDIAAEAARQAGLEPEDLDRTYRCIHRLVSALIHHDDREELNRWISNANLMVEIETSLNRSYHLFNSLLDGQRSRRRLAEAQFGQACLFAIQEKAQEAADRLRQAGKLGGDTCAYLNRAVLDNDFNNIRSDRAFQALWSESGSAQAKSVTAA